MKTIRKALAAALLAAAAHAAPAAAQEAPQEAPSCIAPEYPTAGVSWFLGLHPMDDLLSAWCRIQTLPGAVRFNVQFPVTGAHRSWDTSFDGGTLPASRIAEIVQSLLPVADGPVRDENGMEFPRVLRNVVQLGADKAPDGAVLGFSSDHPAAKNLVLWEPVVLRVRPVALAGQEFTLSVGLRPSLGFLALGLQGRATDVRLQGWKGRFDAGGWWGGTCSSLIPFCEDVPEVATFHAPWTVSEVRLEAEGENMTAAAQAIMSQIGASRGTGRRPTLSFNEATGGGSLTHTDGRSIVRMEAQGSSSGTRRISITWQENSSESSYSRLLRDEALRFRTGAAGSRPPTVPDSLGRL